MEQHRPNTRKSVWLVIGVPGRDAQSLPELEKALREFAKEWIERATSKSSGTDQYTVDVGTAETEKLRIFEQVR